MGDFKLSLSCSGHDDDVRAVAFITPAAAVSASRDATVRRWQFSTTSPPTYDDSIVSHAEAFVNAVTFIPPTSDFPQGLIASGGKDTWIDVRQPGHPPEQDPERLLLGHEGNVCSLDAFDDGKTSYLISGSWDSSARIWNVGKGESIATLEGHGASVWDVLAFDAQKVVTACADQHIRIYSTSGKLLKEFKASSEPVRALCRLPTSHSTGAQFASAGNDSVIRLWTLEGVEVAQLHGHDNFVYSLASLPNGDIVSSSEDRTVRVWRNGDCIQTITHPAISVWAVAASAESGDIVTGASDKIVRVFTRSAERQADATAIAEFEESVKASAIPQQTMGQVNKDKLPGPEFLQQKSGTKEGQVQMIREANGSVTAHQWSMQGQQWVSVGTVVDSTGSSGRRTTFNGQDYDYVFDVDIEDGKPALKLPFNLSMNPYDAASKFLADNELPSGYVQQVVDFIMKNTEGATLGQESAPAGADPWGTGRRYRPGDAEASPAPAPPVAASRPSVLPQKDFLGITSANFAVISKKVAELNQQLLTDGRKDVALSPGDTQQLPTLLKALESSLSSPSPDKQLDILGDMVVKMATTWPAASRLPALDLFRCLAAASTNLPRRHDPAQVLKGSEALSGGNANMAMLAFRALANLFLHPEGRAFVQERFDEIKSAVHPFVQPTAGAANRNLHIAVTTVYINYSVLLTTIPGPDPQVNAKRAAGLLNDLGSLLADDKVVDSETVYRALVAAGTLLRVPPAPGVAVDVKPLSIAIDKAVAKAKEPRIKGVGDGIKQLL